MATSNEMCNEASDGVGVVSDCVSVVTVWVWRGKWGGWGEGTVRRSGWAACMDSTTSSESSCHQWEINFFLNTAVFLLVKPTNKCWVLSAMTGFPVFLHPGVTDWPPGTSVRGSRAFVCTGENQYCYWLSHHPTCHRLYCVQLLN